MLKRQLGLDLWGVHRLDAETSGVLVFAKSQEAAALLSKSLAARLWTKVYWALIEAREPRPAATWRIDNYLKQVRRKVDGLSILVNEPTRSGGDRAVTDFSILDRPSPKGTLLIEAKPQTGRMHQIRTHLASHGTPIVGDRFYGGKTSKTGLALRAMHLHIPPLFHINEAAIEIAASESPDCSVTKAFVCEI